MADTQELETQAYLDLVKDLLNCAQGGSPAYMGQIV
jgi:hypothetical protein